MDTSFRTERDVEVNLIAPLFRDVLGYPENELEWAKKVRVTFGRETRTKEADLVAHYKGSPVIAVEAKKPTEAVRSGLNQVDSYAFALQTPYSIVTNGQQFVLRGYYSFNSRINVIDASVADLRNEHWAKVRNLISFEHIPSAFTQAANAIIEPDPEKIQDYRRFFRKIHNEIRDRDKLDPAAAFDELSKLLFLKAAEDEWLLRARVKPVLTPEKIDEWEALGSGKAQLLVNEWFQAATSELFPGVFDDHPRLNLSPGTLKKVLELMKPFHVKNGDEDVKGRAFEEFLPSQLRGKGLGQFFTPRPVVNIMAALAAISIQDVVVDFSCGSGGFLIKAFEQMQRYVEQLPASILRGMGTNKEEVLEGIKSHQIFGVDAEPRAARTAKMNMLMWGDGRRVVRGNALDTRDFSGKPYEPEEYSEAAPSSGCTLILANPPFGSKEKDRSILRRYVLAGQRDREAERTEVLFIEKGLKLLQPEGKMLIVLPQGLMSSTNNSRVRDYVHSQSEIRALISLPPHTFTPSGVPMVNTCILYVQKFTTEKKKLYDAKVKGLSRDQIREFLRTDPEFDYSIFMGIAENIGYEPSGRVTVKPGEKTDLDLLLEDFAGPSGFTPANVNLFEFAGERYGDQGLPDQAPGIGAKSLKTSFFIPLSKTAERLDPPYYLLHYQAETLLRGLQPLGSSLKEEKRKFRPRSDADLDAEYNVLSVSSEGLVTLNKRVRGEDFKEMRRVSAGDVVYNPMRINIGSIGVVPTALDGGLVSPDYVVLRSTRLDPDFLVMLLRTPFYRMYIDVTSTGSIRDRLYFQQLQSLRVPDVSGVEQAAICATAHRADEAYEKLKRIAAERAATIDRLNNLVRAAAIESGDTEGAFQALAERWRRETGMVSSITKKINHPAYKKIIDLGEVAVPLILNELRVRPAYWFSALESILKASPIPKGQKVTFAEAVAAWLNWGKENGYRE
jgi:type I restriction enzyme M protein